MGDLLRAQAPSRWARIHHLPGGQRLPAGSAEVAEVLYRNNIVASTLLGIGATCIAFLAEWDGRHGFTSWPLAEPAPIWRGDDDTQEQIGTAKFRWRKLRWRPGSLDREILAAARGELGRLTFLSLATHGVYCPYDGGADLFLPEPDDVPALKNLFKQWLSDLPSGL
jgi:hypothetical protein